MVVLTWDERRRTRDDVTCYVLHVLWRTTLSTLGTWWTWCTLGTFICSQTKTPASMIQGLFLTKTSSNPHPRNLFLGRSESEDQLGPMKRFHACRGCRLLKASVDLSQDLFERMYVYNTIFDLCQGCRLGFNVWLFREITNGVSWFNKTLKELFLSMARCYPPVK